MSPPLKRILRRWENDAASQQQMKDSSVVELFPDKRACKFCNQEFSSGRALGGHIKVHYRKKASHRKRQRRDHPSPPVTRRSDRRKNKVESQIDLSKFLTGWKVHKKRGSNQVLKIADYADQDPDEDDRDLIMIESLIELGFSGSSHQISRTRSRYVCFTCNMYFTTFHAVRCHVYEGVSPTPLNADEEVEEGANSSPEVEVAESSGSMNQEASTSDPPKSLDFDLNDIPPKED